jgi:hypothetical protein
VRNPSYGGGAGKQARDAGAARREASVGDWADRQGDDTHPTPGVERVVKQALPNVLSKKSGPRRQCRKSPQTLPPSEAVGVLRTKTDRITHEIGFDNTFYPFLFEYDSDVLEYEYKTDFSNSDTHSDIHSIRETTFIIGNLQLRNHVKTKILVHHIYSSLRISHSSIFMVIINHILNKTINKYISNIYTHLFNK